MTSILEWLAACGRTDRGRLFLDNLAIDVRANHIGAELLEEFVGALKRVMLGITGGSLKGEDRYSRIAMSSISEACLFNRGSKAPMSREPMICIFRLDEFIVNTWFDFTVLGGFRASSAEELLETLTNVGDLSKILRPNAELRSGVPMVWLARSSEIIDAIKSRSTSAKSLTEADVVRDCLGLLHYGQDDFLCAITLEIEDIKWDSLRRPCAFDGGTNLVYRSNEKNEPEGRAINLASHKPELAEIVSIPVPLRPHHLPIGLGRVSGAPGFSWAKLAKSVNDSRLKEITNELSNF